MKKKYYTISISAKKFWTIFLPAFFVLSALAGLAGYLAVDYYVMPKVVGVTRDLVKVPDVKGLTFEAGRDKILGVGLLHETLRREFDDDVPEGAIISQIPPPDEMVKKSRKVALVVSRGKEAAKIPEVRRMSERHARAELRKHGFTVGNTDKRYDNVIPEDNVIDSDPPPGTTISRAMEVRLRVSRGPRPTHAEMPNVVGDNLTTARKKIEEAGLKVGKVDHQNNPSLPVGTVISQSASPGSKVPLDSHVSIVVSAIR